MIHPHFDSTNPQKSAPIGIFDSGVGGLSVYRHLSELMPKERYVYYADTQNLPYGNKSGDEILFLTLQAVDWLCRQGCKLIIIACNSASAYSLTTLRIRCRIPIVGLVPAVKPACEMSQTRQIALLATQATLQGQLLAEVIHEVATSKGITVHKHFEPMLVPWVESGMAINHHVADLLIKQTQAWYQQGVDILVLGCTHYPFFRQFLQDWIDEQHITMTLLDSGAAIAQRVKSLLDCFGISADGDVLDEPLTFYASDLTDNVPATARRLSQVPISFVDGNFLPINV